MNCPNCGKEMIKSSRRLTEVVCVVFDQIDGDSEYETRTGYRYRCDECNIKYNSLKNHWTIPKTITPDITSKQQNCINIICKNLNMEFPYIINKNVASQFISKYIDKSKSVSNERKEEYKDYEDYFFDMFF